MPLKDEPRPDLRIDTIVEVLNRHGVEYVTVGGVGATLHGAERKTVDCDAVVNRANDNIERLAHALDELGAFMRIGNESDYAAKNLKVDKKWFVSSQSVTNWRTPVGDIDIMAAIPGTVADEKDYHVLKTNADEKELESLKIWVAGLNDIIASKQFANRPKDQEALPELLRIAQANRDAIQRKAIPDQRRKPNRPPLER